MPLRIVTRAGRAVLYVRGTVAGQAVFESTGTGDRGRAEAYRAKREAELWDRSVFGARAVVTFAEAAASYLTAEPRTPGTARLVKKLLLHFRAAPLGQVDQAALDRAYAALLRPGASPATKLRHVITPLRAILEHAARRGWCDRPAFEVPRQPRPRVAFLTPAQATALVQAAAGHIRPLIVFLVATGARMSEALELEWAQLDLTAARAHFVRTKTGRDRRVDLPPAAVAALSAIPWREGRVFRPVYGPKKRKVGAAYRDTGRTGGGQIKTAWAGACRRAGIEGVRPHDLRHTAATWHYAIHRDLLALQAWGGWSGVGQVQVYAHLLADAYVADAARWLGVEAPLLRRA